MGISYMTSILATASAKKIDHPCSVFNMEMGLPNQALMLDGQFLREVTHPMMRILSIPWPYNLY